MQQHFVEPATDRSLHAGPFAEHVDGFVKTLSSTGYKNASIEGKVYVLAQFGQWLERRRFSIRNINDRHVREFIYWRRRRYQSYPAVNKTLVQLLDYLRRISVIPPIVLPVKRGKAAIIKEQYATYLREERGLAPGSLVNHLMVVDRFIIDRFGKGPVRFNQLKADHVTRFVIQNAHKKSPSHAKIIVSSLRSFLRFLFLRAETTTDLSPSVLRVANWRLAKLPKFITDEDVHRLLRACDQQSATGRRDYAILLVLARLGLRAGEVVRMTIDDLDWEAGELIVHSKGGRQDRLPIPNDVGRALVEYLRRDRPCCSSRRMFICTMAPNRGFAGPGAISAIVRYAIARAGLKTPTKGAHMLRHSLATGLLCRGASLEEIGNLLRHRNPNTTVLYAKVDLGSLREAAQPWPGGVA
jgi:site-specific recombinase XerD